MENLIIGKANTMYTLWNKTIINSKKCAFTYLKNISKSLDKVKELYPELTIDESLRGKTYIERTIDKPIEDVDKFNYGKYKGELLSSVNDTNYLLWYLNDNKNSNEAQAEWAKENLNNIKFYDGEFISTKEYNAIIENKTKLETIFNKIKTEKSLVCTAVSNIDGNGFLNVMYEDVNIPVQFTGETAEYYYLDYEYYLPVIKGKAKRIKNKSIILNVEDIEISEFDLQITANSINISK